jgi:DtxR family Mn-dependent transcriptional regulator
MIHAMTAEHSLPELSPSAEDYLKAIYAIERAEEAAGTTDLAQRLGLTPASVSGMVRRLAEQGLLSYEPYRGARLTPDGRRAALRTLRRHRIIECFLVKMLTYQWDGVHEEAERLEHAASDKLIDRMAAVLGEPTFDPHGAPIPTREGFVDETPHATLADIGIGTATRVARVLEHDAGMLRYLDELGIRPGAEIVIVSRAPFGGPITLEVGGVTRAIGPGLAEQVLVMERGV